jgi:hypothetical protein
MTSCSDACGDREVAAISPRIGFSSARTTVHRRPPSATLLGDLARLPDYSLNERCRASRAVSPQSHSPRPVTRRPHYAQHPRPNRIPPPPERDDRQASAAAAWRRFDRRVDDGEQPHGRGPRRSSDIARAVRGSGGALAGPAVLAHEGGGALTGTNAGDRGFSSNGAVATGTSWGWLGAALEHDQLEPG